MPLNHHHLRELRLRARLTQQAVANAAGLQRTNYIRLESGRNPDPKMSTLERLAVALGVSVAEIVGK